MVRSQPVSPTCSKADDILSFRAGDVRIRELITYQKFKKFEVGTTIKYGSPAGDKGERL